MSVLILSSIRSRMCFFFSVLSILKHSGAQFLSYGSMPLLKTRPQFNVKKGLDHEINNKNMIFWLVIPCFYFHNGKGNDFMIRVRMQCRDNIKDGFQKDKLVFKSNSITLAGTELIPRTSL